MRLYTKEKVKEIADFLKKSKETLTTTSFTCCKYDLDGDLALFVGWLDGYDPNDDTCIHDTKNPTWCLNAGIKIKCDCYWADYEYLNMPIFTDDSGDVAMTDCSLSPNDDYIKLARYFLKEYIAMRKAIDKGELSIDL